MNLKLVADALSSVQLVAFDFDGVFTDNTVLVNQDGVETVRCWRSDGLGLSRLRGLGVHLVIISTETNPVVTARARKLKLPCQQGVEDKAAAILATCRQLAVDPANVVFVGNDINDIPAFHAVGLPVAVADAYPEVLPHVMYRTHQPGGHGAVREICDLIFHAKQGTLNELDYHAS
jgi:3-deoxy-D-manno-octulosonate 8-phosphate phosphatase (KDO 8-P phosphatase)